MNSVQHVAIIMDGNGRWAEQRGMPRWKGHEMGVQAVRRISEAACRQEIPILTLFAFSSENWKRPADEVRILFNLFQRYLVTERQTLLGMISASLHFGRRDRLPPLVREALSSVEEETRALQAACTCASRWIMAPATKSSKRRALWQGTSCAEDSRSSRSPKKDFCSKLSPEGIPDPDLIIRTAGEQTPFEFPSLAGCLFGILFLSEAVAGL